MDILLVVGALVVYALPFWWAPYGMFSLLAISVPVSYLEHRRYFRDKKN